MDYIGLGRRIKTARREQNITQEELSARVGISLSFLGHIERGSRKASMETLVKLANTLGESLDHLMRDSLHINEEEEPPMPPMEVLHTLRSPQPEPRIKGRPKSIARDNANNEGEVRDMLSELSTYLGIVAEDAVLDDSFADWDD